MAMNRRDTFKLAGVAAAAAALPTMAVAGSAGAAKKATGKSVVIVGGGFGGLTMAKALLKKDKNIDVTVIDKKDIFMACPFSNTLLGGLEGVTLDTLTHDFYSAANKHGYNFVHGTVTAIDRKAKTVMTTNGDFNYDILVLSPGIAYDYEKQFPKWSKEKIAHVAQTCPAALMPGSEHLALKRQMDNMDDGNIIIIPPASGKYRCPPAPYERVAMAANYMKKEGIAGKVVVLDTRGGKFAKGAAFKESWKEVFGDMIEYIGDANVTDVDPNAKKVTYTSGGKEHTTDYQVCNLIPINKCSPVIAMAGLETNAAGFAVMDGYSFRSKTDKNVYVIGDAVTHKIPPSGQTAIWGAHRAAGQVADQLNGKKNDATAGLPAKAANVCFSMVNGSPEEAIMVTHTFSADAKTGVLKGKGNVPKPKDGGGKFRSKNTATATREWFDGVMREMFS
jgi:NADPH-dependent 2,4-dienoyl-CoA reductase/sulfur reductase-like enzyme